MPCLNKTRFYLSKFLDHIKSTSCHGVSHFANSPNKKTRIFWAIFSTICLGAMCYFIAIRIKDYQDSSIVRVTDYETLPEFEIPKFTICSKNNFDDTDRVSSLLYLRNVFYNIFVTSLLVCAEKSSSETSCGTRYRAEKNTPEFYTLFWGVFWGNFTCVGLPGPLCHPFKKNF